MRLSACGHGHGHECSVRYAAARAGASVQGGRLMSMQEGLVASADADVVIVSDAACGRWGFMRALARRQSGSGTRPRRQDRNPQISIRVKFHHCESGSANSFTSFDPPDSKPCRKRTRKRSRRCVDCGTSSETAMHKV